MNTKPPSTIKPVRIIPFLGSTRGDPLIALLGEMVWLIVSATSTGTESFAQIIVGKVISNVAKSGFINFISAIIS